MIGDDTVSGGGGRDTLIIDYAASGSSLSSGTLASDGGGGFSGTLSGFNGGYTLQMTSIEDIRLNVAGSAVVFVTGAPGLAADKLAITNTAAGGVYATLYLDLQALASTTVTVGSGGVLTTGAGLYSGFQVYDITLGPGANHLTAAGTGASGVIVHGGAGSNVISTGAGADQIISIGADTVDGGGGVDTWTGNYFNTSAPITFSYDGVNATSSNGVRLSNIETVGVTGGSGDDIFTANSGGYGGADGFDTLNSDFSADGTPLVAQLTSDPLGLGGNVHDAQHSVSFGQMETVNLKGTSQADDVTVSEAAVEPYAQLKIDAGAGMDTLHLSFGANRDYVFIVGPDGAVHNEVGVFTGFDAFDLTVSALHSTLVGGTGVDTLTSGAGVDRLTGGGGNDIISTGDLNDALEGDGGDDRLDGGQGTDTAIYNGPMARYAVTYNNDATYSVRDTSGTDGKDALVSVELLQFTDGLKIIGVDVPLFTQEAITAILRVSYASPTSLTFDQLVAPKTPTDAVATIIGAAASTTSVATLSYEFFTGHTPSTAGIDYLVSPTGPNVNNLNAAYYQSFNLENRYINFGVNLGKGGEGEAAFAQGYASLSFYDAFKKAYGVIFGATPSDAHIHAILDPTLTLNGQSLTRQQYFATYGGDGVSGIGTKAAAVGWLLSEAVKADLGTYAKSNDLFLADVAHHGINFGVDVVGVYALPGFAYHA